MRYGVIVVILLGLCGCVKDKPNPTSADVPNTQHRGIYILQEGVFGNNNAEVSFLDLTNETMYLNRFKSNNGGSMGDIAQHMLLVQDDLYIALNNSHRILMVNRFTFEQTGVITGIPFPRQLTLINDSLLAVSTLYSPKVYIVNSKTKTIQHTITLDYSNSEEMLVYQNDLFITNWNDSSSLLYQFDLTTFTMKHKRDIGVRAAHDIELDKNGTIWVMGGNQYKGVRASLLRWHVATGETKLFWFDHQSEPMKMTMDATRSDLYFLQINYNGAAAFNGLYKMNTAEESLPTTPIVQANPGSYFYALGLDDLTQRIYLADPKGFTQQSTLYEYSMTGKLIKEYRGGLGVNQFLFP